MLAAADVTITVTDDEGSTVTSEWSGVTVVHRRGRLRLMSAAEVLFDAAATGPADEPDRGRRWVVALDDGGSAEIVRPKCLACGGGR